MHRIFISDLHLEEEKTFLTDAFVSFLRNEASDCDELYILGDLFNYWIGDREASDFHLEIAGYLSDLGAKKYFIQGNRDFLVGRRFCRKCGMELLSDETVIRSGADSILLCHGDSLCTLDAGYQKFRRFRLNPVNRFIYSLLPAAIKRKLAEKVRNDALTDKSSKTEEMMDIVEQDLEKLMKKTNCGICIHGHTHKPGIHENREKGIVRYVLGDWRSDGFEYLEETDGKRQLVKKDL